MDALFVVVAELLIVPLIMWALVLADLSFGVLASIAAVLLGRRSPGEAIVHRWKGIRRRVVWGLIFFAGGLILADLVFFQSLVHLALAEIDEREDIELDFAHAEGSFMLGRIELHQLHLGGTDPSSRYDLAIDTLVIDIDTEALLSADFAVEEIALDGIEGSFERLVAAEPKPKSARGLELAREFSVDRFHVGDMHLVLHDRARTPERELDIVLAELDLGPLHSQTALFDLLYRARGRGAVAGHPFELTALARGQEVKTTLELRDIPLDALGESLEKAAGLRARGQADLTLVNTYSEGPPEPKVELAATFTLRGLELEAGEGASGGTRLMLGMAERALVELGEEFPLAFEITLLRSELEGMRSLAEAGVIEQVGRGLSDALRDTLRRAGSKPGPE